MSTVVIGYSRNYQIRVIKLIRGSNILNISFKDEKTFQHENQKLCKKHDKYGIQGMKKKGQTAISMYKNFQNIQVKISAKRASLWIFIGRVKQNKSTVNILRASHLEIKLLSFHAKIYMYMYFLLWHWRVSYLPLVHGHFIK